MLSNDLKSVIAPQARIMLIIWGAFSTAPMIYLALAWLMYGRTEGVPDAEATTVGPIGPALAVVALLVVTGSIAMERLWFSGARIKAKLEGPSTYDQVVTGPRAAQVSRDAFERLPESEKKLARLIPYYQTGMIIVWAMREAVAIFGLIAAIMQTDFMVVVPFAVGSLLLVVIKMPRPAAFLEQVRNLPGAMS